MGLFNGLNRLQSIWLNRNNLSKLEAFTFQDLKSLMWLSLGYNQLKSIHSKAFAGSTQLKELYLDNNKLNTIKMVDAFEPLKNLVTLCLNNNPIGKVFFLNKYLILKYFSVYLFNI